MTTRLGIIVPCYNEEEVLPETNRRLLELLTKLQQSSLVTADSAIYFVDDGSKDRTWEIIESLAAADSRVHGIKLSRNRGHQNALLAGLFGAEGDALVTVDAGCRIARSAWMSWNSACGAPWGCDRSGCRHGWKD